MIQTAIYVKAPPTGNGNSKRGWLIQVVTPRGIYENVGFLFEEQYGKQWLKQHFPQAIELHEMEITNKQWKELASHRIFPSPAQRAAQ